MIMPRKPDVDPRIYNLLETAQHTRWFLMTKARRDPQERLIVDRLAGSIADAERMLQEVGK